MKKVICLLFVAMVAFGAKAYDFQSRLAALYHDLPAEFGRGLSITEVTFDGDNVVYSYVIDEDVIMFEAIEGQKDMFHDVFVAENVSAKDPTTIEVRDACIAEGKGIKHHFSGSKSGKTFDVVITTDELK